MVDRCGSIPPVPGIYGLTHFDDSWHAALLDGVGLLLHVNRFINGFSLRVELRAEESELSKRCRKIMLRSPRLVTVHNQAVTVSVVSSRNMLIGVLCEVVNVVAQVQPDGS